MSLSSLTPLLSPYTQSSSNQLLTQLQSLSFPESTFQSQNQELQQKLLQCLKQLLNSSQMQNICSFLSTVWKSLSNKSLKKQLIISILDTVLECIRINELKGILAVISERIGEMRENMVDVSYHLLRIVNTLLKRISKTTDYHVRGELHLTITKIINFCHQSGFQYRNLGLQNSKGEIQENVFDKEFSESNLSIEFYNNFWELQKYFSDPQQLIREQSPSNPTSSTQKQDLSLLPIRLKKMELILSNILSYFKLAQPSQCKNFETFPIKFLKLPNLLGLQLQDSYFRILILIQFMIFCNSLEIMPNKNKIKVNQEGMDTVNRIKNKIQEYFGKIIITRNDLANLGGLVDCFFRNQAFWINLKDNWRQKKKTFFKTTTQQQQPTDLKKTVSNSQNPQPQPPTPPQKPPASLSQTLRKVQKQIKSRMQIKPAFIERFLAHTEAPVLKKQAISPSFAYYYSQAKQCIDTFDDGEQCQTQFQSRSEYNLFEWKAFRSLSRERIVTTGGESSSQKTSNKFSEYKLLEFIKKKEEVFEGESPRKRVKVDEEKND